MREEPTTHDIVVWVMKLEKERIIGLQGTEEAVPTGLPEIYFVEIRALLEKSEPVVICDSYVGFHLSLSGNLRSASP